MSTENYMHLELDYDGNYYYFDNKDIVDFSRDVSKEIDDIFNKYLDKVDRENSPFILGNKMFFTYNGVKYRHGMTSFLDEENYLHYIYRELREIEGITDIVYIKGYLD